MKIHALSFFVSFAIGLFFCYILTPPPEVVLKFPSPYNAGKIVYKDKAETCYTYKAEKVNCPLNKTLIKAQPIFEDFKNRKPQKI